jgi:hypothetical protein
MVLAAVVRDYVVAGTATDGSEIRKFADQNIQAQIDRVLASAPAGTKAGIILYANASGEVKAGMFGKKDVKLPGFLGAIGWTEGVFTYGGTLTYDYRNKDLRGEAQAAIWFK